jgi:hypothetical protein
MTKDRTRATMSLSNRKLQLVFWCGLLAFLVWDTTKAPPVDLRNEPPLIAAGSGKVSSGGHCAIAK